MGERKQSTAQWYRVLVEKEVTMVNIDTRSEYIKSRAELASPETDWETSWRRARMRGLGTEVTSFLWKLLHNILPTEQRLSRILPNSLENCKFCQNPVSADLLHCLLECVHTLEVGGWLLALLRQQDQTLTPSRLLRLEFSIDEEREMPMVWITGHVLLIIWKTRVSGKIVNLLNTRAALESKISLLRETRYLSQHQMINQIYVSN